MSRDHLIEVSLDFLRGVSSSQVTTLLSLGSTGLVKVEIKRFWFVTWTRGRWVMRFCRWGPLFLSYHPAMFGVHKPCESGYITLFICHVTTISKCHLALWVKPLILSHHPAKFGVHRPYGTGNDSVCNISSNSNSNSNSTAEVPMPRITNGQS